MALREGVDRMTSVALVIGLRSRLRADGVRRACAAMSATPVFIDDWASCRVALDPASRRFDLWLGREHMHVPSETIGGVLLFDRPRPPDVAISNRAYQGAEFEALLVGMLLIARPVLARYWSSALAGISEADIDCTRDDAESRVSGVSAAALFALGSGTVWCDGSLLAHRDEQGRIQCCSELSQLDAEQPPTTFYVDANHRVLTPYVGYSPEWICDDQSLLQHALAQSPTGHSIAGGSDGRQLPLCGASHDELTIVAHSSDSPAAHLFSRALARGAPTRLIDLRFGLSSQCSDREFDRVLAMTSNAAFVFARPLPARSIASGDRLAKRRHGAILRSLQARRGTTLNPPASGYTNLSKAAHLVHLSALGLPIPPSLVTNDPGAAREFIRTHAAVVYKSVSHARSITTRFAADDDQRLVALEKCPVLFQAFVAGPDYRVHTIADRALTTRIKSDGTDYRVAGRAASYRVDTLHQAITSQLVSAAQRSGLVLSGVDLRVSERGQQWFVFEMNRMPAFDFYDHRGGSGVADAIIELARC